MRTDTTDPELMSFRRLESESTVSRYTWRAWVRARRVPSVRLGRRVFILRSDYQKFIAANRREAREGGGR